MPSISIIICTYGRCAKLRETLASIAGARVPRDFAVELVVVENGAKGDAERLTADFRHESITTRYFFRSIPNKSNALNQAILESTGEFLLFTDDDVRVPAEWIVEMCLPLVHGEGEVVVGGCRLAPTLDRVWMTRYHRAFLACTEYLSDTDPSEFAGVNMACRREVFAGVDGFDSELGGGGLGNCEDSLFARQLKQAGNAFVSRTRVCVEHHPSVQRLTYKGWLNAAASVGRSRAYVTHHWEHETIWQVHIRFLYFWLKLHLRSLGGSAALDAEGIAPWELSYRVSLNKLRHFLHERRRPRNYEFHGVRKKH